MHAFTVHRDGNRYIIRCEHSAEFVARAEPDTDQAAAQRLCDALNVGFGMGYTVGEADAQLAMRRALGMA